MQKVAPMNRLAALALVSVLAISACETTTTNTPARIGADGRPVSVVYRISAEDAPRVRQRMQDGLNTMRSQNGVQPLTGNAQLASAAATHARDMSFQQRPWHWGSDGSSPMQRAQRAGYRGEFTGELISETFENEVESVNAWMLERETRAVILDPRARDVGVGWHQDQNGKIWWTVVLGTSQQDMQIAGR